MQKKRKKKDKEPVMTAVVKAIQREIDREVLIKLGVDPESAAYLTKEEPEGKIIKTF